MRRTTRIGAISGPACLGHRRAVNGCAGPGENKPKRTGLKTTMRGRVKARMPLTTRLLWLKPAPEGELTGEAGQAAGARSPAGHHTGIANEDSVHALGRRHGSQVHLPRSA